MLFIGTVYIAMAQNRDVMVRSYIDTYKQLAIDEMKRTGVPAAIKLAQGIHETEAGNSELVRKSNNHFGIKCKTGWYGDKVYHDDDEKGECFRSYGSAQDSYADHSNFLKNSQRYAFLFSLDPTDYKAWAYGLKKAGYATNIKYSQILIKLIEEYGLDQYSLIALGRLPAEQDGLAINNNKPVIGEAVSEVKNELTVAPLAEYPVGEFVINKTRVVVAKAGSSWLQLAQQYDIALARLLDFNDVYADGVLQQDQLVYLQRKRKTGDKEFHTVTVGETVYSIAQTEGIRLESLLQLNNLINGMQPATGEKIYLLQQAPQRPLLATEVKPVTSGSSVTKLEKSPTRHAVQPKETLYGIAKKYGVTVNAIMEWNKLQEESVRTGQLLIIYSN